MKHLPEVTVVAVTTKDYGPTITAIKKTLEHIDPYDVLYFSDVPYHDEAITHIPIDRFTSVKDYNRFMVKELGKYLESDFVLVVQHDGYVLDGDAWLPEFLEYDYIGAPWTYTDGRNVGNGGFSLRSKKLQHILCQDQAIEMFSPEDEVICRFYRQYLEEKYGIKYAPDKVAHKFSFEMHKPKCRTFGFHNYFHQPYREPVILKRSGAMGDVIMMEPIMDALHKKGHRVILDTPPQYYNLFGNHFYPIEHIDNVRHEEDISLFKVINLDMAYEISPKEPVWVSYARTCSVDLTPRNPKLAFGSSMPLFDKYIVLHTDDTDMPHRNVHGVDWDVMASFFSELGYLVLRVGNGNGRGGLKVNTFNETMLAWIIAGAKYFVGIDSGPAQIAVATGVKSAIFFGSVDYSLRYPDVNNILTIQKLCPILKDGCYHSVISVRGTDCEVEVKRPPCITYSTPEVIDLIKSFLV